MSPTRVRQLGFPMDVSISTTLFIVGCYCVLSLATTGIRGQLSDDNTSQPHHTSDARVCLLKDRECTVLHEWVTMDYQWPNSTMRQEYEDSGRYNPKHCLLSGLKLYRGQIFVTIPRIRYYHGVPAPLNRIVTDPADGKAKLEPFPDWGSQQQGSNCDNLQMAMSIEIDPLTGYLYVIDPGRPGIVGTPEDGATPPNKCPPKLVIYDINQGTKVRSLTLPSTIASKDTNFLNDIVLDRGDVDSDTVRWVYITDAIDSKLYVIDLSTDEIRALYDPSMDYEDEESVIEVNGKEYTLKLPIDGLAMSHDFKYVYYCALGSRKLWRVPTFALRDPKYSIKDHLVFVGNKISQTGGMIYATDNLYYGGLSKNAVYKWAIRKDMEEQGVDEGHVKIKSETEIVEDDTTLIWPDAFAIDDDGYMYFTACRANLFLKGGMDFTGGAGANFRIWKVKIDEQGYLSGRNSGSAVKYGFIGVVTLLLSIPLSRVIYLTGVGET